MAGEIFISYRRSDEAWARMFHAQLQAQGVEAWYDAQIGAGQDWRGTTANALQEARIFVLLFSAAAAESEEIVKELAAAIFTKKMVVPVRIENIDPTGAFLYELASRNWVEAFENTEAKLGELAQSLAKLVKAGIVDESIIPFNRNSGANAPKRGRDWRKHTPLIIACMAAIGIAVISAVLFWHPAKPDAVVANFESLSKPTGVSIAVLPFLNLSSDKEQEFFSDGITEEITSALAKVPGLTVIGRTSAFQFKGENKDMRTIGRALGVSDLIEGSVRKAGDRVRITAQLIKVDDGTHLWTESYDRKLTDIFAVQEDIAKAIAGAMQIPLGLRQGENLISSRTDDLGAYQEYLHARALYRARKVGDAVSILKRVVARDPTYAPAWALLSLSLVLPGNIAGVGREIRAGDMGNARILAQSILGDAEKAAREAIRLDPRLAMGYAALAPIDGNRGKWIACADDYRQALALDPNDPDILFNYASFLADIGRLKDARKVQIQILAQEPFVPQYKRQAADVLWAMGQNEAALKILQPMDSEQTRNIALAKVYATVGRYKEAADTLRATSASDQYPRQALDDAARLLQSSPQNTAAPNALPTLAGTLNFVYLFVGEENRYLDGAERLLQVGFNGGLFRDPWAPPSASLRKLERFKTFARESGFVAYWRARGWPEFCHPFGADDFVCN